MATAADVPGTYDVVINGNGYVFLDSLEPSLPFRTHKASYTLSPTFVERQNTSGDYGDNQQDFYLTFSQNDWSLGEQQRYFRTDDVRRSRYWTGTNIDTVTEGAAGMRPALRAVTLPQAACAACAIGATDASNLGAVYVAATGIVFEVSSGAGASSLGAHGLGANPSPFGIASDGKYIYVGTTKTVDKVRFGTAAGGWADFSAATGADSLEFLNNTLYGFRESTAELVKYSTAGVSTSVYTWKFGQGSAALVDTTVSSNASTRIRAYGSRLLILRGYRGERRTELWQYDGTSTNKVAEFPANFVGYDMDVNLGVAFISGIMTSGAANASRQTVFQYDGTNLEIVWQQPNFYGYTGGTRVESGVCGFAGGAVFFNAAIGTIMYYDIASAAVSTLASGLTTAGGPCLLASASTFFFFGENGATAADVFPGTVPATTATLTTSLVDFDSSLDKYFKAVRVDWEPGSTGNGGSVDVAYQLNTPDGSYTTVQTGAVSGTEYAINQSGRSITIKVTLNKGTSIQGPTVKRIYVRAVPVQPQYKLRSYVLDVTGRRRDPNTNVKLRSGRYHTKDGAAMASDLLTAVAAQAPISITDRFGTYTGIIQPDQFELLEIHPGEYVAQVVAREV